MAQSIIIITPDELRELVVVTVREQLESFFKKEKEPDNRLLTRKEVSGMLGISLPTLSLWTKSGVIQAVRIGNSIRYKSENIEQALQTVQNIKYLRNKY